jgi:hypothetical protein
MAALRRLNKSDDSFGDEWPVAVHGRNYALTPSVYCNSGQRRLLENANSSNRPGPVTGENLERPLAANAKQREAAVRNAQTIFALGASGSQRARSMATLY